MGYPGTMAVIVHQVLHQLILEALEGFIGSEDLRFREVRLGGDIQVIFTADDRQ